jgi:hypothetical protein
MKKKKMEYKKSFEYHRSVLDVRAEPVLQGRLSLN